MSLPTNSTIQVDQPGTASSGSDDEYPPFKTGDTILKEFPFLYTASPEFTKSYCCYCFYPGPESEMPWTKAKLSHCARCGQFVYCSRSCQKADWLKFHKYECHLYVKYGKDKLFEEEFARSAIRCWALLTQRPEEMTKVHQVPGVGRLRFVDLLDHVDKIKKDEELISMFSSAIQFLRRMELEFDEDQLFSVLARFHIYSCDILDFEKMQSVGSAVYLGLAMLDHSCAPNAAFVSNGAEIRVQAIKDISPNEPLYTTLIDILQPTAERQDILTRFYYTDCSCVRCLTRADDEICRKIESTFSNIKEKIKLAQSGKFGWKKVFQLFEQLIHSYERVIKFHPIISYQKVFYLCLKVKQRKAPKINTDEMLKGLIVTHGEDHPFTVYFEKLILNIDYTKSTEFITRFKLMS